LKTYYEKLFSEKNKKGGEEGYFEYPGIALEISGDNYKILEKVKTGEITPKKINTLYKDGKLIKLQALFVAQKGQNVDIYLTGEVLTDFIKEFGE